MRFGAMDMVFDGYRCTRRARRLGRAALMECVWWRRVRTVGRAGGASSYATDHTVHAEW